MIKYIIKISLHHLAALFTLLSAPSSRECHLAESWTDWQKTKACSISKSTGTSTGSSYKYSTSSVRNTLNAFFKQTPSWTCIAVPTTSSSLSASTSLSSSSSKECTWKLPESYTDLVKRYLILTIIQESISKSPVLSFFSETISGISVVRAFDKQIIFLKKHASNLDLNRKISLQQIATNIWFQLLLSLASFFVNITAIVFCVNSPPPLLLL